MRLSGPSVLAALLVGFAFCPGCSQAATLSEAEAENAAQVLLDESSAGQRPNSEPPLTSQPEQSVEYSFLDGVADCMKEQGFEFVAAVDRSTTSSEASPYGITASLTDHQSPDPNEEILAGLSPQDEKNYLETLWGNPSEESEPGCAGTVFNQLVDTEQFETDADVEIPLDRGIESLRLETEAKATARADVNQTVAKAESCVIDRLGVEAEGDPFDFTTHAERRVAAVIDPDLAAQGATLFDMVESGDEPLALDEATITAMEEAEQYVWATEVECRHSIQETLDNAFVEEASKSLMDSPELGRALLELRDLDG